MHVQKAGRSRHYTSEMPVMTELGLKELNSSLSYSKYPILVYDMIICMQHEILLRRIPVINAGITCILYNK